MLIFIISEGLYNEQSTTCADAAVVIGFQTTSCGDVDNQTTTHGDVHGDVEALSVRQQQTLEQLQLIVEHIGKL